MKVMNNKKIFLELDYVLHREKGWDNKAREEFEDAFIELIESFEAVGSGGSNVYTADQYDALYLEEADEEEE